MTSNIGAQLLVDEAASATNPAVTEAVMGQVRSHFAPEFINRIGMLFGYNMKLYILNLSFPLLLSLLHRIA
jgi:ATP-dependent Clp protease ATP-binding subunit ClpA